MKPWIAAVASLFFAFESARADDSAFVGDVFILQGGIPGTFEIPGTNISLGFGGFAKLDVNFSSVNADGPGGGNTGDQFVIPALIPIRDVPGETNQITFNPRESRFWFKGYAPSKWGAFNAYVELDFYAFQSPGDERISDSFAPRLRHAYGSLGPLLADAFMNVVQVWPASRGPSEPYAWRRRGANESLMRSSPGD